MISVALTVLRWRHVRDPVIDQTPRRFFDAPVGCWMGVAVGFVMTLFVCAWLGINGQSVLLAMFMAPLIGITTVVAYQVLDRLSLGWRK